MPRGIAIADLDVLEVLAREYSVPMQRPGDPAGRATIDQILALAAAAQEVQPGSDFDALVTSGHYILTSDANAPFAGGRWFVRVRSDPVDPTAIVQEAVPLTGGTGPTPFSRRAAAGVFGAWISSGAPDASGVPYDDSTAFPGATNVQQALEMSAAWIGAIRDVLMLQEFVAGLTLGNWWGDTAKANYGVTIAAGQCRGNGVTASKTATWAKMLNDAWVKGFGYGGLDTGTIQPNTTYHCHAIRENSTGDLDFLFSTSATSPVMPSGWTRVQRLGAVLTDANGNIRPFVQSGNEFWHNVVGGISDFAAAGVWAKALFAFTLPAGLRVQGIFQPFILANSASVGHLHLYDGIASNISVTMSVGSLDAGGGAVVTYNRAPLRQFTNTYRQVYVEMTAGINPSTPSVISTLGWVDYQIPRVGA